MNSAHTLLKTALALAHRGLRVFPCRPRQKEPATQHGFLDATVDITVIKQWWASRPDYNVAIATGANPASSWSTSTASTPKRSCAARGRTWRVAALGRGDHGARPACLVTLSGERVGAELDRQDCTGLRYQRRRLGYVWRRRHTPERPVHAWSVDCTRLADPPSWLLNKIALADKPRAALPPETWIEIITSGAEEGTRNDRIARLAGHLLCKSWLDPRVVLELMHCWNATRCTLPLAAAEVRHIVNSIAGREIRKLENA